MTTPLATYRVQLHAGFGFDDVAALAPYLAALGVSHVYCSPYLQAAPGSTHGYDVVDHTNVNEELGGREAFERMCGALAAQGLSHIVDIVPNHMSTRPARLNRWWWDVLARGPASPWAGYFDIDWDASGRVLIPVLGDHYGRVIDAGEIAIEPDGDGFVVRYHEHEAPVAPGTFDGDLSVNGDPDRLDAVLERQHYRLAHWRTAGEELDYRRFFDISELIALQVHVPAVFDDVHRLVLGLVAEGRVDGLRVDHPDGLRDPRGYFERLRSSARPGTYLVAEKILEAGEDLPPAWPIAGTTGYDFLNVAAGLFVDPAGEQPLTELYQRFTGNAEDFEGVAYECRKLVIGESLATDLRRLAARTYDVLYGHRHFRDHTRREVHDVLAELAACFPVYRTYIRPGDEPSDQDRQAMAAAAAEAGRRRPDLDARLVGFLADLLLGRVPGPAEADIAMRFQQFSAPVMAKGVEDTAFYRYLRLACLNEVGGHPGRFGTSVETFHRHNERAWPETMLGTSTHDTKRSEDVRVRLALLSEIPGPWALAVRRWATLNDGRRTPSPAGSEAPGWPDANTEYLVYQTVVGAWPIDGERAVAYVLKAAKEAKQHTSWVQPDEAYERALTGFVTGMLADETIVAEVETFVRPLVEGGRVASLAQLLLKLTSPGVPDIYQGTELWDLSLVDPDNRRPVDFELRRRMLDKVAAAGPSEVLEEADDGAPKLWLMHRVLAARRGPLSACLSPGSSYQPLVAEGEMADHAVAYLRGGAALVVVPRLVLGLAAGWGDTSLTLPPGRWDDGLGGHRGWDGGAAVPLTELLDAFPVALLARR